MLVQKMARLRLEALSMAFATCAPTDHYCHEMKIRELIGPHKTAKENKVFVGERGVAKIFHTEDFKENLRRQELASVHGYGPLLLSSGAIGKSQKYIVTEKLHPVLTLTKEDRETLQNQLVDMHTYGGHMHGDIHFGNILRTTTGEARWSDFDLGQSVRSSKVARAKDLASEQEDVVNIRICCNV